MSKYDQVLMDCAELWAEQSYCEKAQVGAVLALDGRVIATGYNGTVDGLPNVCEIDTQCPNCHGCGATHLNSGAPICKQCNGTGKVLKTSPFTVHAEQNVLMFCAREGIPTKCATMYITLSPCANCAKLMVQAGIKRVVYLKEYKDVSGIDFLKTCGIKVSKYDI